MPEISDQEYDLLRRAYTLLDGLASDPKVKPHFEKLVKYKHPQVTTTEDELRPTLEPVQNFMKEARERWEKEDQGKVERELEESFKRLAKDNGYTEDGINKIKQLMVDRRIADPEAAAALWERQNPAPKMEQSNLLPMKWVNNGTEEDRSYFDDLMKDPDGAADRKAVEVFNELANARNRG